MLHARRCGWLSAQQLGMLLLERARERGVELRRARLVGVDVAAGRVAAVRLLADGGAVERLATGGLVLAAGPLLPQAAALLGVELPVFNELHAKVSFVDHLGVLPRDAPLTIWADPIAPAWSAEERAGLAEEPGGRRLLGELPAGAHFRPEGGAASPVVLMLWTYDTEPRQPVWPPRFDPFHPHVVLRGLTRMVPALAAYGERMRAPYVDGGYYCKTRENRPLLGPLPVAGAYVLGALSGYGIMASQAAAEVVAAHVTGETLPPYAAAFAPARYDDPAYVARLPELAAASGQL
jgi:glycine/D-amino acid oxidase-like deaminating enzyme